MTTDSLRPRPLDRVRAAVAARWWPRGIVLRRALAAALFLLALALALWPGTAGAGQSRPVVVAARDLPAGATLGARDVRLADVPKPAVPGGALSSIGSVRGRVLAAAARAGEQLTDVRLVGRANAAAVGPGRVSVPVRLADEGVAELLRPGSTVDVVSAAGDAGTAPVPPDPGTAAPGTPQVLATGARVVTVRPKQHSAGSATSAAPDGRLVVLALPRDSAHRVAASSLDREVTVTLR